MQFTGSVLTAEGDMARRERRQRSDPQLGVERGVAPRGLGKVQTFLRVDAEIGARRIQERVRDAIFDRGDAGRSGT